MHALLIVCSAATWHNKRLYYIILKLTQFCKEIKQENIQSKLIKSVVNYILSRLSIHGATYLSMGKKPKNP